MKMTKSEYHNKENVLFAFETELEKGMVTRITIILINEHKRTHRNYAMLIYGFWDMMSLEALCIGPI